MLATIIGLLMALAMGLGVQYVPEFETSVVFNKDYFELFFIICFFLSTLPWIGMLFLCQGAEVQPISVAAQRSNLADRKLKMYSAALVQCLTCG